MESFMRAQGEKMLAGMDLVRRDEFEAVKAMAGAGASETAISNFANCMQEELTKQGMQEQQFVMLLSAVWSRMQAGTAAPQPGSLGPAAAAARWQWWRRGGATVTAAAW